MSRLVLVRLGKGRRLPAGTYGQVQLVTPRLYAVVRDPLELALWLFQSGRLGEVGPVPSWLEREARDRAVAGEQIPGVDLRVEGSARMRVFPAVTHAGVDPARFLWESPLEIEGAAT